MSAVAVAMLVTTSLYAGFQATIRIVVYPQFAAVGAGDFVAYEHRHQRLVTYVVGPLFAAEGIALTVGLVRRVSAASIVAAAAYALILVITGLAAVPAHGRLGDGFDSRTHGRLLTVDTLRLVLALLAVAAAVWFSF